MSSKDVARAFVVGTNKASGNHMVTHDGERSHYYLHGSRLVTWDRAAGTVWITHTGYPTVTTAKAVNAVLAECDWLGATMKGWIVTDATGATAQVTAEGVTLYRGLVGNGKDGHRWTLAQPTHPAGNAPALSK